MNAAQNDEIKFENMCTISSKFEESIDWQAVKDRFRMAILDTGVDTKDILEFVGLDFTAEDYMQQRDKLPKLKTALAVASFMGIPAEWTLTGKGERPRGRQANSFRDAVDSAVVQGNSANTLIVHNGGHQMSEQKKELNRIFDVLSIRDQTRLLHLAYEIEESAQKS